MLSSPTKAAWLVQTDAELAQAIRQLAGASVLAIDTEFLREKTYRAQLCLLQLASAEQALLIDPLAGLDLRPLGELLWSPAILKVLHAGYQDLEILLQALGQPVAPIFDTQLAAAVLGLPQQVSLAVLVKHYTGVELAKIDTFSDWSKRPLRVDQLGYALDDVRYLPQIHDQMQEELRVWGRESWLADEFQTLARAEHFSEQPDDLWRRLKGSNGLSRRQLAVLRELAVWRDAAARQLDIPRRWLVADEQLVETARRQPKTTEELYRTRGLQERLGSRWPEEVLAAVDRGRRCAEADLPRHSRPAAPTANQIAAADLLQVLVHHRAAEQHIAASILAPPSELTALAAGQRENLALLDGWRRELIGNELLELLAGRRSLSLVGGHLKVTDTSQTPKNCSDPPE